MPARRPRGIGPHAGASIIGGIGLVSGVECLITASESTVKGGAISEYGVARRGRLAEIARQNRLPSICMTESAGADLPEPVARSSCRAAAASAT